MSVPTIDLEFPPEPASVSTARLAVNGLGDRLPREVLDEVRLLVTELVSNSVKHAELGSDGWIRVRVGLRPDLVRGEVIDPGPGFTPVLQPPSIRETGWGTYLVDRIASRWGVRRDPETHVWFEIDLDQGRATG